MHRTPKHQLADILLGESLIDWIDARRPESSWRKISNELIAATDGQVDVTPESLRAWYVAGTKSTPPSVSA